MTTVERLADSVAQASYEDPFTAARDQLEMRVLDSLGREIGTINGKPAQLVREHVQELDHDGRCTLIGGGRVNPDRAPFYNGVLVQYLDYNDSYLAKDSM